MAKVHTLAVQLCRDYKSPLGHTPEVSLKAGAPVVVHSVFKRGDYRPDAAPHPALLKGLWIEFRDFDSKDHPYLDLEWGEIVPPKECTLSQNPPVVYCATKDNFIILEPTTEASFCPLCGKAL